MQFPSITLYELLRLCTVRLSIPGEEGHGTGFFVAHTLILTCAHVVKDAWKQNTSLEVYRDGRRTMAQVIQYRDNTDLALLQVNLRGHPCAYCSSGIEPADDLYTYGYPHDQANGDSATFVFEGWSAGHKPDQPVRLKFKAGQVIPGLSGAPLLNKRTASICGIVTTTRDASTDLGGRAISTDTMFQEFPDLRKQQQQFHQKDKRWTDCRDALLHQSTLIEEEATLRSGKNNLMRGQNALMRGDYIAARRDIEKALDVIPEDQLPKEAAKGRYLQALMLLNGKRPYVQTMPTMRHIISLMNSAIQLHSCYSYLFIFALFKRDFARNGLQHFEYEAQQLLMQARLLTHQIEDTEIIKLFQLCQPDLARDYRE